MIRVLIVIHGFKDILIIIDGSQNHDGFFIVINGFQNHDGFFIVINGFQNHIRFFKIISKANGNLMTLAIFTTIMKGAVETIAGML
jgi:hypothetical protein